MRRLRRFFRRVILLAIVFSALLADSRWHLEVTEYEVSDARIPAAFEGFRILQLSDLHLMVFGEHNERLLGAVSDAKPDLIAITGDMVDIETGWEEEIRHLARALTALAPTYYVSGNHEWACGAARPLFSLLEEEGVTVLRNRWLTLERGGESIVLAGVDDPNGPRDMMTPAEISAAIRQEAPNAYTVLLAHRNTELDTYAAAGFDFTLCGHGHGGVIRLPGTDGLINTNREWLPSYTGGLYTLEGMTCLVSRGLGNNLAIPRILNRPHIPVAVLHHQ